MLLHCLYLTSNVLQLSFYLSCVVTCCRSGMVFYLKTQFWENTAVLQHLPPCRPLVQLHGFTFTLTSVSPTKASTLHIQHHQVRNSAYWVRVNSLYSVYTMSQRNTLYICPVYVTYIYIYNQIYFLFQKLGFNVLSCFSLEKGQYRDHCSNLVVALVVWLTVISLKRRLLPNLYELLKRSITWESCTFGRSFTITKPLHLFKVSKWKCICEFQKNWSW